QKMINLDLTLFHGLQDEVHRLPRAEQESLLVWARDNAQKLMKKTEPLRLEARLEESGKTLEEAYEGILREVRHENPAKVKGWLKQAAKFERDVVDLIIHIQQCERQFSDLLQTVRRRA